MYLLLFLMYRSILSLITPFHTFFILCLIFFKRVYIISKLAISLFPFAHFHLPFLCSFLHFLTTFFGSILALSSNTSFMLFHTLSILLKSISGLSIHSLSLISLNSSHTFPVI